MFRILIFLLISLTLSACVTPTKLGISETEWQTYTPEQREKIKSGYYQVLKTKFDDNAIADGSILQVKVSGGKVNMPTSGDLTTYSPIEFEIDNGKCRNVEIHDATNDNKVEMKVCFRNKTLYLDPSRYDINKKYGSIQLHYSPIWDRGFTFQNVSSSGYVHLTNVNVSVRKYDNEEIDSPS